MTSRRLGLLGAALLFTACAPKPPIAGPSPGAGSSPDGASVASLPIAAVTGPTRIVVQYPLEDAMVDARDSTFLLGSIGTGDGTLSINGMPVKVWPNGGWLAWVALPAPDVSPSADGNTAATATSTFRLVARSPRDSSVLVLKVRRAATARADSSGRYIDLTSFVPSGVAWVPASEDLRLQVRAAPGAQATLLLADGTTIPLAEEHAGSDDVPAGIRAFDRDTTKLRPSVRSSRYVGVIRGRTLGDPLGPMLAPVGPSPEAGAWARVRLTWPSGSLEAVWPLRVTLTDSAPQVVRLDDDPAQAGTTDSITVGRATPGATYYWFFPTGTRSTADRRQNSDVRLRLSAEQHAWVSLADVEALPPGTWPPLGRIGSLTSSVAPNRATIRIPVGTRVPFHVAETERGLSLELYGAVADIDWTRYAPTDTLIEHIDWRQDGDIVRIDVVLRRPLYGYRTRWDGTDLLLDIRRPPSVDRSSPLKGRLIAVDPGHPPGGATGPTGLREAEANLAIALELQRLLQAAGATVIMTRTTDVALDLGPRIALAEAGGAEVLVSIHNNALPDGVNPFTNNGTSVFYNHLTSLPLARAVQHGLVRQLGLRDLGVGRGDLALVRPTWQPSILTEGLYMIVPEQEAALRSSAGQRRYAQGVLDGLRSWLAEIARY